MSNKSNIKTTANESEVAKFSALADKWWDINGDFKLLHTINPLRLKFITKCIMDVLGKTDIAKLKILDVGCGGGLVSVPLAKMGADVLGVDASENNIKTANQYVKNNKIQNINFEATKIEDMPKTLQFDVIIALEVVEHVSNVDLFLSEIVKRLKPGGVLIISTINRSLKSLMTAKFAAEYILHMLPKGTHQWRSFVTPEELHNHLKTNCSLHKIEGMKLNILQNKWFMHPSDTSVNYIACYQKKA